MFRIKEKFDELVKRTRKGDIGHMVEMTKVKVLFSTPEIFK